MAERQFGPYRLVRQIAVGGMAEIHLAKTKGIAGFEKYVALKMIHPNFAEDDQFIQMLVDEAKIAVQLNHGNIAQTFDLGRVGDTYYITMEYVDGADLYKILRRASEADIAMPLDVAAFVAKEIASALDHAHRKKDHLGKMLGIVHRDVSPQNVLISYAGEVKLVDFGIAKATMKARQTAVGVIKGKYYYMSPEQAWGDLIDARSDIFSAGIVLYEMITGQMLYLEEDLQKLLEMARTAAIAPPSTLRKGVPPQLERIVMHALAKEKGDRYQSAADLASDLERFLHSYSPVFTAAKLAGFIRKIIGDRDAPDYEIELRDQTGTLSPEVLIHTKDEIRDDNSVIFRAEELAATLTPAEAAAPAAPAPRNPTPSPEGRLTRPAETLDIAPRAKPIPSVPRARPTERPKPARNPHEDTRQVSADPPSLHDDSSIAPPPPVDSIDPPQRSALLSIPAAAPSRWTGETEDLENSGDHTLITGAPAGFIADGEAVEATLVSLAPAPETDTTEDLELDPDQPGIDEDTDGPTIQREPVQVRQSAVRGPPPAALAAKIRQPAVSELRKPRASRKTPSGGVPAASVLQAIVGSASEPMPVPRPAPQRTEDSAAQTLPGSSNGHVVAPVMAYPLPPPAEPDTAPAGAYAPAPPYPPPTHTSGYGAPPVSPSAIYPLHPFGAPPSPMSITGQLRLTEMDELPAHYRVGSGTRWVKLAVIALVASAVAGAGTFVIMRVTRKEVPTIGALRITSSPPGATVYVDGQKQVETTPLRIDASIGQRHEIRVELARHLTYLDSVELPKSGTELEVAAMLKPITGKLVVVTEPDHAEIWIDGQRRGVAPTTINDIDMTSAKHLELRLKDYQPYVQDLVWPANGEIDIEKKLTH